VQKVTDSIFNCATKTCVQGVLPLGSTITPERIIVRALEVLATPDQWTKFVLLARDGQFNETSALDPEATRWTLLGALRRAATDVGLPTEARYAPVLWHTYDLIEAMLPHGQDITRFNDMPMTTHEMVVGVLMGALQRSHRKAA
jgi:hypothetical protein